VSSASASPVAVSSSCLPLVAVIVGFAASRAAYTAIGGVRFDATPLYSYLQYADPVLLRDDFWRTVFHMHTQPPLFNMFIGAVLKAAPGHETAVFHACFLGFGLALATGSYRLLRCVGVAAWPAAAVAILYEIHPTTVLYENWLFYECPLAAVLCWAGVFLFRFLCDGRGANAVTFFALLATMVLMRGTFHLVWFALISAGLLLIRRGDRMLVAQSATIPALLVVALYAKHFVLYRETVIGKVYQQMNLALMMNQQLPHGQLARLLADHKVSPLAGLPIYLWPISKLQPYLPPFQATGVPLLDQPVKSSGAPNWEYEPMIALGELYDRDARVLIDKAPDAYGAAVWSNLVRCTAPADKVYPFSDPANRNAGRLRPLLIWTDRLIVGQWKRRGLGWCLALLLPAAVVIGLLEAGRRWRIGRDPGATPEERRRSRAESITLLFCEYNVLYVSVSTILMSHADQNRYRFSLTPLFLALLFAPLTRLPRLGNRRSQPPPLAPRAASARMLR